MSIRIMTDVWEHSEAKGTELLLLLAIADYANDEGRAWPSLSTLGKKCRVGVRHVVRLMHQLEDRGEIKIMRRVGRRGNNHYVITCSATSAVQDTSTSAVQDNSPGRHHDTQDTSTSVLDSTSLVTPRTPDPLRTIKEPPSLQAKPRASPSGGNQRGLTDGQRYFLTAFGAKRFKTLVQKDAVGTLEQNHDTDTFKAGTDWAAKQGMNMGKAVIALETALPKWGGKNKDKVIRVGR